GRSWRGHTAFAVDRAEYAVYEAGSVGAAELLGRLDGLVDGHFGGHVLAVKQLVERHAQDVALQRRDAVERPSHRVALDQRVELRLMLCGPFRELAGERGDIAV